MENLMTYYPKVDVYSAVFNGHVNDANKRAMEVLDKHFPDLASEIRALDAKHNGIMGIFRMEDELTPAIAAYAALVTAFVYKA